MADGPFGNPLSTGVALSFEVDMTPYRQMHARKMANIEEKKKQRKKQQKELEDVLKNITVDTSKVHERYRDDAMNEYASTIKDVMDMHKNGNVAGVYQRINKFNSGMNSYVQATQNFNDYVKSKGDKTFRNDELIRAMNDVQGISDDDLYKMYQNDIDYSNGMFNFTVIDRPDLVGYANKLLQGVDKTFVRDDQGNVVESGKFGPKGTRLYKTAIPDADTFIKETANWLKSSAGGARLLMEYGGITADKLDERTPDGRQKIDVLAEDYVKKNLSNKLYGEKQKDPFAPRAPKATYGSGDNNLGDVFFSEAEPSPVESTYSTEEQKQKAARESLSGFVTELLSMKDPSDPEKIFNNTPQELKELGFSFEDPADLGDDAVIKHVDGAKLEFDASSPNMEKEVLDFINQNVSDDDIANSDVNFGASTVDPETTQEQLLKPTGSGFNVKFAGGREGKTTWELKGGQDVYIFGDSNSEKISLNNTVNLQKGEFIGAREYEDESGDKSIYYEILFPVGLADSDSYYESIYGDLDKFSEFKKQNKGSLPKSILVKDSKENRNTLKSLISTRETKGMDVDSFLKKKFEEISSSSQSGASRFNQ